MKQLDEGLWVADQPLAVAGVELGARMTVVRLVDGQLLLHSPIRPAPHVVDATKRLGEVAALVAPNRFHHMFAGEWLAPFPQARLFLAPGLDRKRADLAPAAVLGDEPDPLWKGVLEQVVLRGIPLTNEVVFFHVPSRTLIVTDLAFHMGPEQPLLTRIVFRLGGAYGRLAPTSLERLLVRDRDAFRRSFERILAWPFERVIVAHGTVVESGGRSDLERSYAWLGAHA